jgi:hypothetical protein
MECGRCNANRVETLGNGEAVLKEQLTLWKQKVGATVFIDVRCIAAIGRLGQPMNQSINQSINPFYPKLRVI